MSVTCLRKLRAKSDKSRKTREQIAHGLDKHSNADLVSNEIPCLAKLGLVDSLRNRPVKGMPGGVFITEAGLDFLKAAEPTSKSRPKRVKG